MTPLGRIIHDEIASDGPMRLDRYMALCLGHPAHGYYVARDALGRDFTTAPEISQMFGELVGLWAAETWRGMGAPARTLWVELGPGRGALTADALRAARRAAPAFAAALEPWFVETSPKLRAAQSQAVPAARHVEGIDALPEGPAIVVANEFFDALPIRQFVRRDGLWRERVVAAAEDGLRWALGPAPSEVEDGPAAREGAVLEVSPARAAAAETIGRRLAAWGGAALVVDYGAAAPEGGGGDTLQALANGRAADPLAAPGEADLTTHVDFAALARAFAAGGAAVAPLAAQGDWLRALGIEARAAALARATPARAAEVAAALRRLTAPDEMGTLFKALAATGPSQPPPPGFGERT